MKTLLFLSLLSLAAALEINVYLKDGQVLTQESVAVSDRGLYCTFIPGKQAFTKITVGQFNDALPVVMYDAKSHLVFFKADKEESAVSLGSYESFPQALTSASGEELFIEGIERRVGGFVTPFPFYHAYVEDLSKFQVGEGLYADGKLVGIYYRKVTGVEKAAYLLPSQVIFKSLNDLSSFKKTSTAYIGLILDSNNYLPVVVGIRPGSPAEKAGIHVGDVITQFNNQKVESYESFASNVFFLIPEQEKQMEVVRAGKKVAVTLVPGFHPFYHSGAKE